MKIALLTFGSLALLSLSACYVAPPPPAPVAVAPAPYYYPPAPAYYAPAAVYGPPVSIGVGFGGGWRR